MKSQLSETEKKARAASASRKYYAKNREKIHAKQKVRDAERREYTRARDNRRTDDGRDQVKFAKQRAKKRGLTIHFTLEQWNLIKEITGRRCQLCCTSEKDRRLTVDHIVPLSLGGNNTISNIQPLCGRCNSAKNRGALDFREICKIAA